MEQQITPPSTLTTLTQGHWNNAMDLFRIPVTEPPMLILIRFGDISILDAIKNFHTASQPYSTATYHPYTKKLVIDNQKFKDFTLYQYIRIN